MKWHALTSDGSATTYESGEYRIVQSPAAFGWWKCDCYLGLERVAHFVSEGSLEVAMAYCARHSQLVPELEFSNVQRGGER